MGECEFVCEIVHSNSSGQQQITHFPQIRASRHTLVYWRHTQRGQQTDGVFFVCVCVSGRVPQIRNRITTERNNTTIIDSAAAMANG